MKLVRSSAAVLALLCTIAATHATAQSTAPNPLATAQAFPYEQMTVKTAPNGGESRRVVNGTLATGEVIAVHETMQPVGAAPNPAHTIQHSEVIVVQQGTLEFFHDGKTERAGAGSILYVAVGTMHAVKNIGDVPLKYVVVQIGGDVKK